MISRGEARLWRLRKHAGLANPNLLMEWVRQAQHSPPLWLGRRVCMAMVGTLKVCPAAVGTMTEVQRTCHGLTKRYRQAPECTREATWAPGSAMNCNNQTSHFVKEVSCDARASTVNLGCPPPHHSMRSHHSSTIYLTAVVSGAQRAVGSGAQRRVCCGVRLEVEVGLQHFLSSTWLNVS